MDGPRPASHGRPVHPRAMTDAASKLAAPIRILWHSAWPGARRGIGPKVAKKGPKKGPKMAKKGPKKGQKWAKNGPKMGQKGPLLRCPRSPKKGKKWPFLAPCGAKSRGSGGAPPTHLILLRNQLPSESPRAAAAYPPAFSLASLPSLDSLASGGPYGEWRAGSRRREEGRRLP